MAEAPARADRHGHPSRVSARRLFTGRPPSGVYRLPTAGDAPPALLDEIALGYEDIVDHDQLRHDPVLGVLGNSLTSKRSDCAPLAGKPTLIQRNAPRNT